MTTPAPAPNLSPAEIDAIALSLSWAARTGNSDICEAVAAVMWPQSKAIHRAVWKQLTDGERAEIKRMTPQKENAA